MFSKMRNGILSATNAMVKITNKIHLKKNKRHKYFLLQKHRIYKIINNFKFWKKKKKKKMMNEKITFLNFLRKTINKQFHK